MRLLCVQDDEDTRDLLSLVFLERGHAVMTAATVAQAMKILAGQDLVDAVVADSGLPDGNGRDLAQRARQLRPEVAVVLLAPRESRAEREASLRDGVTEVLPTPVRLASLVAVLERIAVRKNCSISGERV